MADSPSENAEHGLKRRRTAHACDSCRLRKTRCDGREPCQNCTALVVECVYGTEAVPKGKSDLILNAVLRMEKSIGLLDSKISSISERPAFTFPEDDSPSFSSGMSPQTLRSDARNQLASMRNLENATISALHTSTTESILAWPNIDTFPSLRLEQGSSIFHLERSRPTMPQRQNTIYPYTSEKQVLQALAAFQSSINFFYPIMPVAHINISRAKIMAGEFDDSTQACLALLLMALGCASDAITSLFISADSDQSHLDDQKPQIALGHIYFDAAVKKLHSAYLETSTSAAQCLLLAALYFAYVQRPLQAWSLINATATKCRAIMSYKFLDAESEDAECIRRISWSCFILESDYLAELSALPQCGIAEIESSIPLPGRFHTHRDSHDEELSSLYFLACISMRRLLNRVHNLLFDKDTGVNLDDNRFPGMVRELDIQLDEWRELLPPAFYFSVDCVPVPDQRGAFLRQRYLTCRSLIYRPYLIKALVNSSQHIPMSLVIRDRCKICLDACLMHIRNLGSFTHTVMVDTWICAMSMAGTMIILLAAYRTPETRDCIGPDEVLQLGPHLEKLLSQWMHIHGQSISPSVNQAVQWITMVDNLIRRDAELDNGVHGD